MKKKEKTQEEEFHNFIKFAMTSNISVKNKDLKKKNKIKKK